LIELGNAHAGERLEVARLTPQLGYGNHDISVPGLRIRSLDD